MRNRPLWLFAPVLALLAVQVHALPPFFEKPAAYRSMLVTNDGQTVSDVDFAQLVAQTQANIRNAAPNGVPLNHNDFTFLGSFTQCYGGGFITELGRQGVTRYGGNSASTYFETASYDIPNTRSFYSYAWATMADPLGGARRTDEWITWNAYDALDPTKGALRGITKNPWAAYERAQYRSDRNGVPQALGAAQHNYAVIWVGDPHPSGADYNDVDKLYRLLTVTYGFKAADIQILWANGVDPNRNDLWAIQGKAEWAPLQAAFKNIENWILAKPAGNTYQVFFYAGDHGNADFPVTLTVEPAAVGMPGTDLPLYAGSGQHIFLGGAGGNWYLLTEQTAGRPLKALSFGDDFQNWGTVFAEQTASPSAIIYFGVDNLSRGKAGSELAAARAKGELQGSHVYSVSANGNRQAFHGRRNFGLVTGANSDEMNGFVVRDMTGMLHPQTGLPTRPVFFTNDQGSQIWVHDPAAPVGQPKTYVYYDFALDYPAPQGPPALVDGLAMVVNLRRRDMAGRLVFDKQQDYMLFSVGRNEPMAPWNAFKPCDVLRFGGGGKEKLWASCNFLGLDAVTDNVDGLDIGAGKYGQPITFSQEMPWPSHEYPNQPHPDQEPKPNYPLPPYDPYEEPYEPDYPGWPMP